ncbi:type I phosphodiesterase/nucleotide pyrophosphatase [Actinocorallia herbida]|uniref:Type I phosphodiesterase/nucleotide pyrophosphatase n=1 Tax=Actinocorallia herbida TaxID=58109 RepID=A0A3N1D798_9ACTN|nr:nucleotide pyrophosphatase/phosphodiesterase family protein [Actinocorallia herbida]ROO89366.1 type I phosphodiesterase/nucleotide pyrophosphatase [Actinocorallia herbida]
MTGLGEIPVPRYGETALADLSSSVLGSLGVAGAANVLDLPELPRACVLLIDGMGWELLKAHPEETPFLSSLPGRALTAGFPATTVTSLSSLSTGLPPGAHGMLGYQVAVPGEGRLLNCLRWDNGQTDPESFQPRRTVYSRAADAGITSSYIASGAYMGSGFNSAITRGVKYVPADGMGQLVARAEEALEGKRAHVTVYHSDLDTAGHMYGAGSKTWRHQLRFVDLLAERLAEVVPAGTGLYVTADHGMTNPDEKVDIDDHPALTEGVALFGGEARARHVYTVDGAADDVLAAYTEFFGDRAWVMSRAQAVAAGCFGPVDPAMLPRIGDVVAVARGGLAIVRTAVDPIDGLMVGMHGSLVPEEQLVPLLWEAR